MWLVWTGGNDRLWDQMTVTSVGTFDFLKTISSYPGLKATPRQSLELSGPGERAVLQESNRTRCRPLRPVARYPRSQLPARSFRKRKQVSRREDRRARQEHSRWLVLRLCHRHRWLAAVSQSRLRRSCGEEVGSQALLRRPQLLQRQKPGAPLPRGMSCAFCHVGPNPIKPPADPENPKWENLSSNVGAQYFWIDRIFAWESDPSSFPVQLFHTSRPGTLDTSLVSSDNINNPRTMNAVYGLLAAS